jgi:hypothetical protein
MPRTSASRAKRNRRHLHVELWPDEWSTLHDLVVSRREKMGPYVRGLVLADFQRKAQETEPRNHAVQR